MEATGRWGRGESKLTRRVKCKELSPWGPGGLGVLGESRTEGPGARGSLTARLPIYLREWLGLERERERERVGMCVQPPPWAAGLASLELGEQVPCLSVPSS